MYNILLPPLLAGLTAQVIKFFIKSNRQKFAWRHLLAYSGMPSGHTAMVIALAASIGFEVGWHSPLFAVSVIFAIIVIRDALGIRRYLGEHGKVINVLVRDLKEDRILDETYPHLLERIGHTPWQVSAGAVIGFTISLIVYFFNA